MKKIVLILGLLVVSLYADKLPWCNDIIAKAHSQKELVKEKTMCRVNLLDIYPTQSIVGEVAVGCKVEKLEKILKKDYDGNEKEFAKGYLCQKKTFLPIVVGYDDRIYITDHHHLSSAILKSKEIDKKELNAFVLHDYSYDKDWQKISETSFWDMMNKEHLVYLKEFGKEITYQQLPTCLNRLKNDSFRTLSRWVRESGCYTKPEDKDKNKNVCDEKEFPLTTVAKSSYYAEFKYADILRDEFSAKLNMNNEVKSLIDIYPKSIKYLKSDYNCTKCEKIKGVDESNYCKKFD